MNNHLWGGGGVMVHIFVNEIVLTFVKFSCLLQLVDLQFCHYFRESDQVIIIPWRVKMRYNPSLKEKKWSRNGPTVEPFSCPQEGPLLGTFLVPHCKVVDYGSTY